MSKEYYIPTLNEITIIGCEFEHRHKTKDSEGNEYYTQWTRKKFNTILDWCGWDVYGINKLINEGNLRMRKKVDGYTVKMDYKAGYKKLETVGELILNDDE